MTDDELIALLCVRIGMIMEDVCGEAVTVSPAPTHERTVTIGKLRRASGGIVALIAAVNFFSNYG